MTVAPVVALRGAWLTFGSGARAVDAVADVTADVGPGDAIAVVGPSGSGKSTLLHLMAGLEAPTRGEVEWPGRGSSPRNDPSAVGLVFQTPSLIRTLDVRENVALPMIAAGESEASAHGRADTVLDLLELGPLGAQLPDTLSGGQAQRAAIARTLALRPPLILADEPTGQLDSATGARVLGLLRDAASWIGAALVVSTHDRAVSARLPLTWRMRGGRLETTAVPT